MVNRSLADRLRRRFWQHVANPFDARVRAPLRRMRNSGRNYRPIFVAGASGSGTSFLAVALGQRFDCAGVIYETNLQVSKRSVLYVPPIDAFESVASYQHAMGPHESWSVEAGRRDLLDLYRSYGSGRSDVVIDKGPDINLLRAGFLHRCFPDGRFLLVFRDPVTNVEGLRRKWPTFAHDPLAESIRFYAEIHERFLRETEAFPDRVIAVEYESLVEHHEETLLAIGRRMGLAPARRQRRLRPAANVEGQGIRNVRRNQVRVVTDANRRSYKRLGPAVVAEIRAALDPLHARLRGLPFKIEPRDCGERAPAPSTRSTRSA